MIKYITNDQLAVITKKIQEGARIESVGISQMDDEGNMWIFEYDENGTVYRQGNTEEKLTSNYWTPDGKYISEYL